MSIAPWLIACISAILVVPSPCVHTAPLTFFCSHTTTVAQLIHESEMRLLAFTHPTLISRVLPYTPSQARQHKCPQCRHKDVNPTEKTATGRGKQRRKSGNDIARSRQTRNLGSNSRRPLRAKWSGKVLAESAYYEVCARSRNRCTKRIAADRTESLTVGNIWCNNSFWTGDSTFRSVA